MIHPISGKLKAWDKHFGNFACNHIGCEMEADFIVGSSHHDYAHFCAEHLDLYDNQGMRVIPIVREVITDAKPKN